MTFYIDPGTGSMLFTKLRFKPSGGKAEMKTAAYLVPNTKN